MKDPYKALGLRGGATKAEVHRAYRKLAVEFHPDKNPDDAVAEKRFKEIQLAYESLIKIAPDKRPKQDPQTAVEQPISRPPRQASEPETKKRRISALEQLVSEMEDSLYDDFFGESK